LLLGALYVCLLGLLLLAARRLPTRGALLEKAHLADQPLLMKLPRNITELQEVRPGPSSDALFRRLLAQRVPLQRWNLP
jgi:hypothetical protein